MTHLFPSNYQRPPAGLMKGGGQGKRIKRDNDLGDAEKQPRNRRKTFSSLDKSYLSTSAQGVQRYGLTTVGGWP
jgi:hypothetical protein